MKEVHDKRRRVCQGKTGSSYAEESTVEQTSATSDAQYCKIVKYIWANAKRESLDEICDSRGIYTPGNSY